MRLEFSREAEKKLDEIRLRYPDSAARIIEAITDRTRQIALFPDSGRLMPKWEDVGLRSILEGRYLILYAVGVETIVV